MNDHADATDEGDPPRAYAGRWRLQRRVHRLYDQDASVIGVVERLVSGESTGDRATVYRWRCASLAGEEPTLSQAKRLVQDTQHRFEAQLSLFESNIELAGIVDDATAR